MSASLGPLGQRRAWSLLAVALSGGLLHLYAGLDGGRWLLGWVVLAPWLLALDRARSVRVALALGWAMSVSFVIGVFGWLPLALHRYTQGPLWLCWALALLAAPLLEPQLLTFALARQLTRPTSRRWLAEESEVGPPAGLRAASVAALVYVGTEWLWPKLFADTLGHGQYGAVYLRQAADLAGVCGLTLVLLLGNELIAAAVRTPVRALTRTVRSVAPRPTAAGSPVQRVLRRLITLAVLFAGCWLYGAWRYHTLTTRPEQGPPRTVGIVQANLTHYAELAAEKGTYEGAIFILDTHARLSEQLLARDHAELLIWPETVYPTTFGTPRTEEGAELDGRILSAVARWKVPLIFGTYDRDREQDAEYNAAVFLGAPPPDGAATQTRDTYRKARPFPLTEYVPPLLDTPAVRAALPWLGTWKAGPGPKVIPLALADGGTLRVAPLICYDAVHTGDVAEAARQGAELIVTLSNDAWFSGTPAPRLHLIVSAFRSIETRLPQVRATNSGISAFIDATGTLRAETESDVPAALAVQLPRLEAPPRTGVVAWGDWLGPTALLLGTLLVAGAVFTGRLATRRTPSLPGLAGTTAGWPEPTSSSSSAERPSGTDR